MTQIGTVKVIIDSSDKNIPIWEIGTNPPHLANTHLRITKGGTIGALNIDEWGETVRSETSPGSNPRGIGGDDNVIWHCDTDTEKIYELATSDLSVVQSTSSESINPSGIGGDENVIWQFASYITEIHERAPTDLSIVRSSSKTGVTGLGGDSNVIWSSDAANDELNEFDTSDFALIRTTNLPNDECRGAGGNQDTIWVGENVDEIIYQYAPSDFSLVDQTSKANYGIVGQPGLMWVSQSDGTVAQMQGRYENSYIYKDGPPSLRSIKGQAL